MKNNECTCCGHVQYINCLCEDCAQSFCVNTCGRLVSLEYKEPATCRRCGDKLCKK